MGCRSSRRGNTPGSSPGASCAGAPDPLRDRNPQPTPPEPEEHGDVRVLITGSSGQIGTNLGLALLEQGHDVLGLDHRPNSWTAEIPTRHLDLATPLPARRL
ncbi:MAG TPA: NAD-dependent epimerase/dehydratase family protein, partial [Chloroflexota bacterium]|nr:NAD-dependent epimerase/dehydratase family protein [Chloroflexota bacterium]